MRGATLFVFDIRHYQLLNLKNKHFEVNVAMLCIYCCEQSWVASAAAEMGGRILGSLREMAVLRHSSHPSQGQPCSPHTLVIDLVSQSLLSILHPYSEISYKVSLLLGLF